MATGADVKLLVLGGTLFLGRHIVQEALDRGHEVTLFNRGSTFPELFPEVEKLRGDRDGGLHALRGREWDAVIDTSGYVPRLARAAVTVLQDAVGHYTFLSTISVYADDKPGVTETAAVKTLEDPTTEEGGPRTYGALKALCELAVDELMPNRSLIVRPGLLVGPHDPTGRFTYWVERMAKGGEVLAPGDPDRQVQLVDARDVAAWILRRVEDETTGTFNVTGPGARLSMGELLETCREALNRQACLTWVAETFLTEHEVRPWTELPLWLPSQANAFLAIDNSKALRLGLAFRPLASTIADTFQWAAQQRSTGPSRLANGTTTETGLEPEREVFLLQHWNRR